MLNLSVTTVNWTALTALWQLWVCARNDGSSTKRSSDLVVVIEFCSWFLWHTHRQHRGRSTLNIYFVLYFLLLPSDVHLSLCFFLLKTIRLNKGIGGKKCITCSTNNHYQNHLEDLYCWIVEYTLLYPLLNYPMHVWFWKSMCECSLKAIFC